MVVTPHNLLQIRYPVLEPAIPDCRLQKGETKVDLESSDNRDTPFDVMVPGKPVEVMKRFWMKELGWTRQGPVHPKQLNDAVQVEGPGNLQEHPVILGRTLFKHHADGVKSK